MIGSSLNRGSRNSRIDSNGFIIRLCYVVFLIAEWTDILRTHGPRRWHGDLCTLKDDSIIDHLFQISIIAAGGI